jgi:hypothetical protein
MGHFQDFNFASGWHACECLSIFAIAIPSRKARSLTEGYRFTQLLSHPFIAGMRSDVKVYVSPGRKFNVKDEIDHRQEITRPIVLRLIVEKDRPSLTRRTEWALPLDVVQNRGCGDRDT